MIRMRTKGSFDNTKKFINKAKNYLNSIDLDKYGAEGVAALSSATPVNSGLTSKSWYYEIIRAQDRASIFFKNSNVNNGVPIAIILQSGHATRNGGWVEGIDYINPAVRPIFERITDSAWKEVTK